jgi:CheY-like chemotaxis protein
LLVDDDDSLRTALARAFRSEFDVVEASSGLEALRVIATATETGAPIDVILLDVEMPGLNGREVYESISSTAPHLLRRVRVMSGGPRAPELAAWCASLGAQFVPKTMPSQLLRKAMRDAVHREHDSAP